MRKTPGRLAEIAGLFSLAALLVVLPFWQHRILTHHPLDDVLYDYHRIALYSSDVVLCAALAGWLASRLLSRGQARFQWGPAALVMPLIGFPLLGIAGRSQAVDLAFTSYTIARLGLLLVFYWLLVNAPLRQKLIAWPLAAAIAVQAVVGVPQFLLGHTLGLQRLGEMTAAAASPGISVVMAGDQRWLRAYGLTQHPNVLGGFLMASLLMVAGFYLTQSGWRRIALLAVLGGGTITLFLTFSRAAWLGALGGGLAGAGLLVWSRRRGAPAVSRASLLSLASLVLALAVILVAINWPLVVARSGLTGQGIEIRSIDERVMLNSAALVLIRMRPWLGVGLGDFAAGVYHLAPQTVSTYASYSPVHNVLLLTTAELGFLGGLLWLCLIGSPWLLLWLRRRQVRMTPWWVGLCAAMAALTVASFFDHYLWSFQQGRLLLWLVWGLWAREWTRSQPAPQINAIQEPVR